MTTTTTNSAENYTYTVLPCGGRGVMIHNAEEVFTVTSEAYETEHNGSPLVSRHFGGLRKHELTTCAACSRVQEQAGAITSRFPGLHRSNVRSQVRDALAALDAAGLPLPSPRTVSTPAGLRRQLAHLVPAASQIMYSSRLAPVVRHESKAHHGTVRWEHVSEEQRDRIRDAYSDLLLARVGGSQQVPCPGGAACLFCGIGSVTAKPAQAGHIWRAATVTRGNLGARRKRSQRVSGHLCPQCAQAREDVGSWGPTAVETAILRHLDRKLGLNTPALNAPAWGALTEAEPNGKPWEHLDLDHLAAELERAV